MHKHLPRPHRRLALLLLFALLSGCASVPSEDRHSADPLEPYNRAVFAFNDRLDRAVLKPAAEVYSELPGPVQTGVGNFFSNLDDFRVGFNNLLQGKFHDAASDTARILFNSSFGVFGLIDVAGPMGLPKHNEDFGQTLGAWGVPAGPYLQLPFLGPSSGRDAPALVVDFYTNPRNYTVGQQRELRNNFAALLVLDLVHARAGLLATEDLLDDYSDDRYVAIRDLWLQRREFLVRDGEVVDDESWLDDLDELDALEALEAEEEF
ncbi:VacJ family lipoprotein [Thioalkalivibrio sp.]|uniref:MlaA family lipoprotein n=1 Tax=Thioalkalivibrio sp. TaxID=2093813 RepID=UPI003569BE9A